MIAPMLLLLLALQDSAQGALQHMQAGADAEKNGYIDVAISEYRKATDLAPNVASGFASLGQVYLEKGDYSEAIPPLRQAVKLNPEMAQAHQLLGYALLAQGFASEAIPHLQKSDDEAALGIAQLEAGQLTEAVKHLQSALSKRPNDQDLLYYYGRTSGLLSKQSIDTLVAAYPDSARAHQAIAENYYVLRQMPQAEKEFQEAIQLRPNLPKLHLELGLVYQGSSQWPKAEEAFREEAKLQPGNAEAAYRLGNALLQQGKVREAHVELKKSDALLPDMPETLYALGKAASLENDPASAEKYWKRVLEVEKSSDLAAQAHFSLAVLYRKQGKTEAAAHEMAEFKKLQNTTSPPDGPQP